MLAVLCRSRAKKARSHGPSLAIVRENGDRFFVVADNYTNDWTASVWLKRDAIADAEAKHTCVSPRMLHKTQPLNNPIVEINKLGFSEFVDIDEHEVQRLS